MTTTRRLAAILAADVAGFSAAMERDEEGTYAKVQELRRNVIEPKLAEHLGRLIKTTGDGFLAEFASPIAATRCALAIQSELAEAPLKLRIGLNLGDVIVEDSGDVYGEGVNVAARLEALADPGGILVSDKIIREVEGKVDAPFEDRGEQQVKNIVRPVRVYAVQSGQAKPAGAAASTAVADASKPLPLPDKPSIAVLPFQNMSGDPEQDYFADGMVEDITTALSRFRSLFVIARNSSFTYKGKAVDIKQVGRELGVRYVLEGSVRKAGRRVRITGQLIEAASGVHLWADRFDGELDDIFELQDQVTASVVGVIAPRIEQSEIELARRKPTDRLDSYDLFLRGMSLTNRLSTLPAAEEFFKKAIAKAPEFASAHVMAAFVALLAQSYSGLVLADDKRAEAVRSAEIAASLAQDDAMVLARAAHVFAYLGRDHARAVSLVDEAIMLNPNLATAWHSRGWIAVMCAESERALESFATMQRLSPLDPARLGALWGIAFAHYFGSNYALGCSIAEQAVRIVPNAHSLPVLIINLVRLGKIAEARSAASQLLGLRSDFRASDTYQVFPMLQIEWNDRIAAALREAGIPE